MAETMPGAQQMLTASGATAVQIVYSSRAAVDDGEHG